MAVITTEEQIQFFKKKKSEGGEKIYNLFPTPDAVCVQKKNYSEEFVKLIDIKKIDYAYNTNFLKNFFDKNEKLNYINDLHLPTQIIINVGGLNDFDKKNFFIFLEKKMIDGSLKDCFYFDKTKNEVIITDLTRFNDEIYTFFIENSNYFEILKNVQEISLKYSSLFEKIYKNIQFSKFQ